MVAGSQRYPEMRDRQQRDARSSPRLPSLRRRAVVSTTGAAGVLALAASATACDLPALGDRGSRLPGPLAARQVLRLNLTSDPQNLDPARVAFTSELAAVMRVFSNLMKLDPARNGVVPDLAQSPPVISADGRTLTFTLRPDVRYSDGNPVQAADFVYSWRRHLDPRTSGEYAFIGHALDGGEALASATDRSEENLTRLRNALGVRAVDARTVEFRLASPAPWFVSVLATWCGVPLRQELVTRGGARWTEPATYIGCGPYVLRQWEPQNRLVFDANPRYHAGPPVVSTIELTLIGDPAVAIAAYLNGELDVLSVQQEDMTAINASAQLKAQLQQFPGTCTTYVGFNTTRSPLDKPEVRRALSLALDRSKFVTDVLGGIGVPAGQVVPPGSPGHYEKLKAQQLDPSGAKRALAAAGVTDPRSLRQLRFVYSGGARARVRVDALVEQIRQTVGVEVVAEPVDSRTFRGMTRSPATAPDLFMLGWCQDYPDPQSWYSALFHSRSGSSSTGWTHPEFDRLVDQADRERDLPKRHETYQRAAQVLLDQAPAAFLYHSSTARLVKPWVYGLGKHPGEYFEGQLSLDKLRILEHD